MNLTEEQWSIIHPLISEPPRFKDGRRRPWKESRDVMNGLLWILHTGACWYDISDRYPPHQTYRRFQQVLEAPATGLHECGGTDPSECYIDGMFIVAKRGGHVMERTSGAKVRSSWQWQTIMAFLAALRLPRCMKSPF